jgi:ABC-2 type transport system ATP-binding protein
MDLAPREFRPKIAEMITLFNLPAGQQPISSYSNGMKRKVSFASAIIHRPDFLILDEPFNGIDFITAREIIKILKTRMNTGTGMLITSHQFDIIAELATHFSILHGSHILLSKPKEQLFEEAANFYNNLPIDEAVKNYVEKVILDASA